MSPPALPVCLDVPDAVRGLVAYGLDELLRGLGLRSVPARRGDARVVVSMDGEGPPGAVALALSAEAADVLLGRPAHPDSLGWVEIDGEQWPLPAAPPGPHPGGADVVASAAWWLAGLQETATTARDRHGRFPYAASLQARLGDAPGGALRPAVDAYRRWLGRLLAEHGVDVPGRTWSRPQPGGAGWAVALTHDLDALTTPRVRALVGDLGRGGVGGAASAVRRALGPDVRWESARALRALARRHGVRSTWFVKPGVWAPEDVPGRLRRPRVRRLVRSLEAEGHAVGWHPGYGAHDHAARLRAERAAFTDALGHAPRLARTHFLRWAEPATPRLLARAGVRIDSTLGFAERPGFRRGTSHPFRVFDVAAGRPTDLWEMPLAVMDTPLIAHGRHDDVTDALARAFAAARAAGGCAVVLWHNQMGPDAGWSRRLHTLDLSLGHAIAEGAAVGPLDRLLAAWRGGAVEKTAEDAETSPVARRSL